MTPEQEAMFRLHNTQVVDAPGLPVYSVDQVAESMEADTVSLGLTQTAQYMASNGPTRPTHRTRARVMTKQQLEEQKMNEAAGLPSNLDEASRVVTLEQKIRNVDAKLDAILSAIHPPKMSEMPPALSVPATPTPAPVRYSNPLDVPFPVAPPPTPPERPVAEVPPPLPPTLPEENLPLPPTYQPPVQPTVQTTPSPAPPVSQPATFLPDSQLQASQETQRLSDDDILDYSRAAAPPSPTAHPIGPVSLGPVGSQKDVDFDQFEITEPGENEGLAVPALVDEPVEPQLDPVEQKHLERQQILTDQVATWLKGKDSHKFWRQFIAGACNKNLSYNTWPVEFQTVFNERFKAIVSDPLIISSMCGRILRMQNGHLVGPHIAGAFIVVTAGFLSFAMMEV